VRARRNATINRKMAALSKLLRKAYKMGDIPQPARVSPPEGADDQVVPHILGHTCASRLVQGGIDIRSVQMWLGHQPLSMTMRYAHSATNDLDGCVVVLEKPRGEQAAGSAESSLFSSPVTTPSAKRKQTDEGASAKAQPKATRKSSKAN
jgi:Phage integrase family